MKGRRSGSTGSNGSNGKGGSRSRSGSDNRPRSRSGSRNESTAEDVSATRSGSLQESLGAQISMGTTHRPAGSAPAGSAAASGLSTRISPSSPPATLSVGGSSTHVPFQWSPGIVQGGIEAAAGGQERKPPFYGGPGHQIPVPSVGPDVFARRGSGPEGDISSSSSSRVAQMGSVNASPAVSRSVLGLPHGRVGIAPPPGTNELNDAARSIGPGGGGGASREGPVAYNNDFGKALGGLEGEARADWLPASSDPSGFVLDTDSQLSELSGGRGPEEHQETVAEDVDVNEPTDPLNVTEQEILANIQDLQRQLWLLKKEEVDETNPETREEVPGSGVDLKHDTRVIVVANRLPISGKKDEKTGKWAFKMSSGGLVTALQGVRDMIDFTWVGWLGVFIPKEEEEEVAKQLMRETSCVPVFLDEQLVDDYYNGFSNDVLWPLFHYVPLPMYKAGGEKKFDGALWNAYKTANIKFAEVVSSIYADGDFVWVHDYHLMRLPYELRQRHPTIKVGWFLHTPFPSSEIYRILPVRKPLLEGLLSADLLGFHTYDYARHFLSSCSRVLEVECSPRGIEYKGHVMSLGVFPIGIDPDHVKTTLRSVKGRVRELMDTFKGRKILLGVDRLDYIKGVPHKLLGLELFLSRHPEWRGKVTLIQVGVPSRTEVPEYKVLAGQVNELVGRINGSYGTLEYSPVHYINQSIDQDELFAIYNVADVCLVTSVRDGMNLVSHEYVAAQNEPPADRDGPGVLVLSEFAGSAQSLSGALRVNPWNIEELSSAIHTSLTLSRVERELRQHKLFRYVSQHTAAFWAKSFMQEFVEVCEVAAAAPKKVTPLPVDECVAAYARAKNRLIISDYDGTLTQLQSLPQLAGPPPLLTRTLDNLAKDEKNRLFIVSGRERRFMETWLGKLRLGLAAEFGFYYRMPGSDKWQCIDDDVDLSWKKTIKPIMQYFTERTPGTYIENKESSLTWHYRDSDPHFGLWQAKDMQVHMEDVLGNLPLEILQTNTMVEVRHQAANKSVLVETILQYLSDPQAVRERGEVDFIFCVGDDKSDEDAFVTLQKLRAEGMINSDQTPAGGAGGKGGSLSPPSRAVSPLEGTSDREEGGGASSSQAFFPPGGPASVAPASPEEEKVGGEAAGAGAAAEGEREGAVELAETLPLGGLAAEERDNMALSLAGDGSSGHFSSTFAESQYTLVDPQAPESSGKIASDCELYTVHIGPELTNADFALENLGKLRQLLRKFEQVSKEDEEARQREEAEQQAAARAALADASAEAAIAVAAAAAAEAAAAQDGDVASGKAERYQVDPELVVDVSGLPVLTHEIVAGPVSPPPPPPTPRREGEAKG